MSPAYHLSDDRMTLTFQVTDHAGTRMVEFGFIEPATAEMVQKALAGPHRPMLPGQRNLTRRFRVLGGTLWVHRMAGPPTWWMPRCCLTRDRSLLLVWLRLGVALRWKREWVS